MAPIALDKDRIRAGFERAAATYDDAAVLARRIADQMLERLDVIRFTPKRVLDAGCGTGYCLQGLARRYPAAELVAVDIARNMLRAAARRVETRRLRSVAGDIERLPLADHCVDMVFSNLVLQWCDPLVVFREFARVLRPGGLLMFSTFGPDTLVELRRAWARADDAVHVHDFLDMHDIGDLLVHTRFGTPVLDVERYTLTYADVMSVLRDLKMIGACNAARARPAGLMGRARFARFRAAYEAMRTPEDRIPATHEVVYGHAWAPPRSAAAIADVALGAIGRMRSR